MNEGNGGPPAPHLRLGGMALRNGLLIHGPTSWAIAARAQSGEVEVASGQKPSFAQGRLGRTPLLRGPLRLAEALAVVPLARMRLRSARLPLEDPAVIGAALAATVASGAIRRATRSTVARESLLAAVGVLPALAALRDRDLAAYHGVEHKAIGAYEQDEPDPATVPKEHERCGSNLIVPMLGLSVLGQYAVERTFERPGPIHRALGAVAGTGVAVEIFAYAERHPESAAGRAVHKLGYEIQRVLSTREPSPEQLEVGVAAMNELLRAEGVAADTV
jgi:uncharacterized protein YqhQ